MGLIIPDEKFQELYELYRVIKGINFKGGESEMAFVYLPETFTFEADYRTLQYANEDAINREYQQVKEQRRSRWNSTANTTNHTLKKLMF